MKQCGSCTKCCEGTLVTVVLGQRLGPKACQYVEPCVGCTIHETRPQNPCRDFECAWLQEEEFDDSMRPDKSGVIPIFKTMPNSEMYLVLRDCDLVNNNSLQAYVDYAASRGMNVAWIVQGYTNWAGTNEFTNFMKEGVASGVLG
jgi:hypothetical protein